jgi:hypothetical protein
MRNTHLSATATYSKDGEVLGVYPMNADVVAAMVVGMKRMPTAWKMEFDRGTRDGYESSFTNTYTGINIHVTW